MPLMQASNQWATRPSDERFTSLYDMRDHFQRIRNESKAERIPSRHLTVEPKDTVRGLVVRADGVEYAPTHWAFGQLAARAEAPAGYLRTLPSPIAADALNYGLRFKRDIEDLGVLYQNNGDSILRAVTGPEYGRIWNLEPIEALCARFGDGVTGTWKVPGEFGRAVTVTKANTTLFAGDRDFFVFLCDEDNRIEIPNRRNGQPGSLARGFFMWNSEVGATTYGLATFLFDYVCCNRMVWGAQEYVELRIRHTKSAPDKFLEECRPALEKYAHGSAKSIVDGIAAAKAARLSGEDGELDKFLKGRFSNRLSEKLKAVHVEEEGRPIESLWDVATAVTAHARGIEWQDERVALERKAGEILDLATR